MQYKCNDCGAIGPGVNHNNRGLKCVQCFSRNLEPVEIKPETKPPTPTPKPTRTSGKRKTT